jgi:ribA/ribD-fused uncharacterized protein
MRFETIETQDKISGFFGRWRFLSNFWSCPVNFEGILYPSAENAYQAAKTLIKEEREKFIKIDSKSAKTLGREITIREDWDQIKRVVMYQILLDKFVRNSELGQLLLDTGDKYLEERNYWNDIYWGVCNGKGSNNLGKILMQVRSQL